MKKLFVLLMFCMILLVGTASAVSFDDFKVYDTETQTYTITNLFGFGKHIADLELKTPQVYSVGIGYQKVAEIEIRNGEYDYNEIVKGIVLYDTNNYFKEFTREVDYKYKVIKNFSIDDFKQSCESLDNGTLFNCFNQKVGSHLEERIFWEDFTAKNFLFKGEVVTLGLFTDVKARDRIEWVINVYGNERLVEWAVWEGGLSVDLTTVFSLDQSGTGTEIVNNASGGSSGTANESTAWVDGKLVNAMDLKQSTYVNVTNIGIPILDSTSSYMFWIKTTEDAASHNIFADFKTGPGRFNFVIRMHNGFIGVRNGDESGGLDSKETDGRIDDDTFHHIAVVLDRENDNVSMWVDGVYNFSLTTTKGGSNLSKHPLLGCGGETPTACARMEIDQFLVWNITVTEAQIQTVFNDDAGCEFQDETCGITNPTITLDSPTNETIFNITNNVVYNATIFDDGSIGNVTFFLNDNHNETNSTTGVNDSVYTFTVNLPDGFTTSIFQACDNENNCINSSMINVTVNTTPNIDYIAPTPVNAFNSSLGNLTVNVSVTEDLFQNVTFDLYVFNGALNFSVTYTNSSRHINWTNLPDASYSYNATVFTNTFESNTTTTRNLTVDSSTPETSFSSPNATLNIHVLNNNLTFTWTANDTNIDTCLIDYLEANTTLTCLDNTTTFNITENVNTNLTFYVNDTFGNMNSTLVSWQYRIFEYPTLYSPSTTEGNVETFVGNFSIGAGDSLTSSIFYYNATARGVSRDSFSSGAYVNLTSSFGVIGVTEDSNVSLLWEFTMGSSSIFNNTAQNQTVLNFALDECTINTDVLYNFTIVDEQTQVQIPNDATINTTGELNLQVFPLGSTTVLVNFSNLYNATNSFAVCLNSTLTGGETYNIDVQVQYSADTYASEFFHIQNDTLDSDDFPTNITLFDLNDSFSEVFKITYKDANFLPVANALIQIQRKYVNEDLFKTVEVPKTDTDGETIAHLELEDVLYTFIIVKSGTILATFDNVLVDCNTVLTDCEINLNSFSSHVEPEDYTTLDDFSFTLTFDEDTRTITSIFSVPSNTISTVDLNATLLDALGTTSACSDTLTSSSGTLSCIVPQTLGNASVFVQLSLDGTVQGSGVIRLEQEPEDIFGANLVFLALFLYLTLIGVGVSDSPMVTGLFLMVGAILGIVLNLVDATGFIGVGATVLWLFVAIVIVLIKGAKRT